MYRLFHHNHCIVIYDKSDKEFKAKYGNSYEQVAFVKDDTAIAVIVERMKRQYNATTVTYDCHIKKKWGWKYFTDEQKASYKERWSKIRTGRPLSDHQRQRISEGKTGKRSNHSGKAHSQSTKNVMSLRAMGHKRINGLRWCHDPSTGKERRVRELIPGYLWGRNPELELHLQLRG